VRLAGLTFQTGPAKVLEAPLPFVQPLTSTRELFENLARSFSFKCQPNCQTTLGDFVTIFLVHLTSFEVSRGLVSDHYSCGF